MWKVFNYFRWLDNFKWKGEEQTVCHCFVWHPWFDVIWTSERHFKIIKSQLIPSGYWPCASDQQFLVLAVEAFLESVWWVNFGAFCTTSFHYFSAAGSAWWMSADAALSNLLTLQCAGQLPLALGWSEIVDQRVQEAVQTAHTQKHQVRCIGSVRGLLGCLDSTVKLQVVH